MTPEENSGWGTTDWRPPIHDVAAAAAVCRNIDPMLAFAPVEHVEKLRNLAGAPVEKKAGVVQLRKLLAAIRDAHDDTALLPEDLLAQIAAVL